MSVRRFRLLLEYDGSAFHGWQYQEDVRTVEGSLREALGRLGRLVETAGASRTDTGVHALGQCALAALETGLEADALGRALQALTPVDLRVQDCQRASADFHPRHQAIEKHYVYRLHTAPSPPALGAGHHWWLRGALDESALAEASRRLLGEHDFAAFQNRSKDPPESSVRCLHATGWQRQGPHLYFQVIGTGFLYKMVRNLVGTLVEVGRGRRPAEEVSAILESRDRTRAGPTAPPQGLYLYQVAYPDTERCRLLAAPPLF